MEGLPTLQPRTGLRALACMKNHPAPPSPPAFFPYSRGQVLPWGSYSVLSSSTVSSVRCRRLRTWYLGLPLVHHLPCGVSGLTQPDAHPGPCGNRLAVLPHLPTQSTRTLVGHGHSPTPLFPTHPRPSTLWLICKCHMLSFE